MKKEIKSLQEIIKSLNSLKGVDIPDARGLLRHLLKHTLNLTDSKSGFVVKKKRSKFYPQIHAGSYNSEKIEKSLSDIKDKLQENKNREYLKGKIIYKIKTKKRQTFLLVITSKNEIIPEKEEIFKYFLKACANILENAENYKKYLEKEKIAAIGLAANMLIHDFKNPLGAIESISSVIKESSTDDVVLECVDIIKEATEGLNCMIKEILDFSKGKKNLDMEKTRIDDLIKKVRDILCCLLEDSNVKFEATCNIKEEILIDRKKLERVLVNLIRNSVEALKTKKGERKITLKVEKKNEKELYSL